jgi:hypothetical protein
MTTDKWTQWAHRANQRMQVRLVNGGNAELLGCQRYTRKCKVVYQNRHETIAVDQIALVLEAGEFEAEWIVVHPWPVESTPDWAKDRRIAAPTLVVEADPMALHPSFLPAADRKTEKLDVSKLRMPRLDIDTPVDIN